MDVDSEGTLEEYGEKHETNAFAAIIMRRDSNRQRLGRHCRFDESG
jgi:hypothetical protein